jgi:hypothetical protein
MGLSNDGYGVKLIMDEIIFALLASPDIADFTDVLNVFNDLLISPSHHCHQVIAKALQDIASPSTIPFVRKALESNFDYLAYTCSDDEVIAKWFSHLLFSIGTDEAIALIEEYSHSENRGISKEMCYRLKQLQGAKTVGEPNLP